jgi:hypothetical protein
VKVELEARVDDQIRITSPLDGQLLDDKEREPRHKGFTYVVRGTLEHLPANHWIWLLNINENFDQVWPQIIRVKYRQGEWEGRIYLSPYQERVIIVAVVAPPTSQDLFRLYAQSLSDRKQELPLRPLTRIPDEIKNFAQVHARAPQVVQATAPTSANG